MKKMSALYALCDPETDEVRYIGQTVRPSMRLFEHIAPQNLIAKTHKNHWIKKLLREGKRPSMIILKWVPLSEIDAAEVAMIKEYRQKGARLTNYTNGGSDYGYSLSQLRR